jgi:hypothetical protein
VSFVHHYGERKDYEVIISHDVKECASPDVWNATLEVVKEWSDEIRIRMFDGAYGDVSNPCLAYNEMARISEGTFLVLTNPECFHENNILGGLDELFAENPDYYIVCACKDSKRPPRGKASSLSDIDFEFRQWYQHTVHTNRCLHFCSAISKENYFSFGGFDEGYRHGSGREDVDFLEMIKRKGFPILPTDELIACHQQHGHSQDTAIKRQINIDYYKKKWSEFTSNPVVKDYVRR